MFEFVLFVLFCASMNTEKIILKKLNGITLKIKTATPALAIKNKGHIFLHRTFTLIFVPSTRKLNLSNHVFQYYPATK